MAYDWEAHRRTCYSLYVDERRSLQDIMTHLREQHEFAPSRRALQSHFRQWKFPPQQSAVPEDARLVRRVHELWASNLSQAAMLQTLGAEGFDVRPRQLVRLRARHQLLLRGVGAGTGAGGDAERTDQIETTELTELTTTDTTDTTDRQAESAERLAARKRRRRTRSWAGLPPDPPGPPRFPSEMPIAQSKAVLGLSAGTAKLYMQIRAHFQAICARQGIVKKTGTAPAVWEAAKDCLVRDTPQLQRADTCRLQWQALDVLCTDVCKRARLVDQRMTLAEAKNRLGLDPRQARDVRAALYQVLREDGFVSKQEAGPEHWQALQRRWLDRCALLRGILDLDRDKDGAERLPKAVETLARDVVKRWQDDRRRQRAEARAELPYREDNSPLSLPPAAPAFGSVSSPLSSFSVGLPDLPDLSDLPDLQSSPPLLSPLSPLSPSPLSPDTAGLGLVQLDMPLLSPVDVSEAMARAAVAAAAFPVPFPFAPLSAAPAATAPATATARFAPYFKLHPLSTYPTTGGLWIGMPLSDRPSVAELRDLAVHRCPDALCGTVQGVLRDHRPGSGASTGEREGEDGSGEEVRVQIATDEQLQAFLDSLGPEESPVFVVQLLSGWM